MRVIDNVKTNLGGNYSIGNGNETKNGRLYITKDMRETDKEMFERLKGYGFKKITFYRGTTYVRGYYKLYALCYE